MAKILKAENPRETMCRDFHTVMNRSGNPARLIEPNLYLIVDVDALQKQVNHLENSFKRSQRVQSRDRWMCGRKKR